MARRGNKVFYAKDYHPIQAGSIDGTDIVPHDHGVYRAMIASSTGLYDPTGDCKAQGDPYLTIFVGRLSRSTTEETLREAMSQYGMIKSMRLVRHIVTGASRGYAFVEYETERDYLHAYETAHNTLIDGSQILVDYNRQQLMRGWVPRRLGGGLGGRKESGQLRFGGRDRPFHVPLRAAIPREELKKLGIPTSPEHYLARSQIPPPPCRKQERKSSRDEERSERQARRRSYEDDDHSERNHDHRRYHRHEIERDYHDKPSSRSHHKRSSSERHEEDRRRRSKQEDHEDEHHHHSKRSKTRDG